MTIRLCHDRELMSRRIGIIPARLRFDTWWPLCAVMARHSGRRLGPPKDKLVRATWISTALRQVARTSRAMTMFRPGAGGGDTGFSRSLGI